MRVESDVSNYSVLSHNLHCYIFEKDGQLQYHGGDSQKSPRSSHGIFLLNPGSRQQKGAGVIPMKPLGSILQNDRVDFLKNLQ